MKQRLKAVWKHALDLSPSRKVGAVLLAGAIVLALVGYLNQYGNLYLGLTLYNLLGDFYANTSAELAGIAITVLIIDALYQRREINREKRDLILQLGSPDKAFAREALRKIRARKWLNDGSLSFADLRNADLEGTNLEFVDFNSANLKSVELMGANLEGANLESANLEGASLSGANLEGAYLNGAKLIRANIINAIVTEKQLVKAESLEYATMPDGTKYDGRFDKNDE